MFLELVNHHRTASRCLSPVPCAQCLLFSNLQTIVDYKIHRSVSVSTEPSKELNTAIEDMFGGNFLSSLKAVTMAARKGPAVRRSL